MINKYTNKQRGLLAVIMAMVMVFAGAAFVAAEVDAAISISTDDTEATVTTVDELETVLSGIGSGSGDYNAVGKIIIGVDLTVSKNLIINKEIIFDGNNKKVTVVEDWSIQFTDVGVQNVTFILQGDNGADAIEDAFILASDTTTFNDVIIDGDSEYGISSGETATITFTDVDFNNHKYTPAATANSKANFNQCSDVNLNMNRGVAQTITVGSTSGTTTINLDATTTVKTLTLRQSNDANASSVITINGTLKADDLIIRQTNNEPNETSGPSISSGNLEVKSISIDPKGTIEGNSSFFINSTTISGITTVPSLDISGGTFVIADDSSIEFDAGTSLDDVTLSDGADTPKTITVTAVAGASGLTVSDSFEISGTLDASNGAELTNGATLKNLTIIGTKDADNTLELDTTSVVGAVNITEGVEVDVGGDGLTINKKATVSVSGKLTGDVENNGTIVINSLEAEVPPTMTGTGSVDASGVASEATLSGSINSDTTFTKYQTVTITADTYLVESTILIIEGKLIIPEGVTLYIQDSARLIVRNSSGVIENNGTIVVESKVDAIYSVNGDTPKTPIQGYGFGNEQVTFKKDQVITGYDLWKYGFGSNEVTTIVGDAGALFVLNATVNNYGTINLDYTETSEENDNVSMNLNGTVNNYGTITVGEDSLLYIWENKIINAEGAQIDVYGEIWFDYDTAAGESIPSIDNSGIVTFDEAFAPLGAVINLKSEAAVVDIVSMTIGSNDIKIFNSIEKKETAGVIYEDYASNVAISVDAKYSIEGVTITPYMYTLVEDNGDKTLFWEIAIAGNIAIDKAADDANDGKAKLTIDGLAVMESDVVIGNNVQIEFVTYNTSVKSKLFIDGNVTAFKATDDVVAAGFIDSENGIITVNGKYSSNNPLGPGLVINAASYEIAKTATTDKTYVYTTLAQAVTDGATKITVTGQIEVDSDITVPSGTTVTNNGTINIDSDATVDFATGAILKNNKIIDVDGTLYVEDRKSALKPVGTITSEVISEGEKDRTYTSLSKALASAQSGDVIKLSDSASIKVDTTIPAGVTVDTNMKGDVTVENEVTLTIDGTLYLNTNALKVDKEGEDDDTGAVIEAGEVVLNGMIKSNSGINSDLAIPGAYYQIAEKGVPYYYVEPVATAAPKLATTDGMLMTINAFATEMDIGQVTFAGTSDMSATVTVKGQVAGDITLDLATISFENGKVFEGTVTNGTGTVTLDGTSVSNIVLASETDDEGVKEFILSGKFDAASKKKVVIDGTVTVKGFEADAVKIVGNADVTDKTVIESLIVEGTVTVDNGKILEAEEAFVLGTIVVAAADAVASKSAGTFTVTYLYLGFDSKVYVAPTNTAGAAVLDGTASVKGLMYVAAGSTFPADMVKGKKYVELYVEDELWMTVYDIGNIGKVAVNQIPVDNVDLEGWVDDKGKTVLDEDGMITINDKKVYADIDYDVYKVTFVTAVGINDVYVDGILVDGFVMVAAGAHTVSYTLDNGYTGEAKMLVDGKEVSGYTFTTEGEFENVTYTITLQGIEKAPAEVGGGDAPVADKDEGMDLTDILLIVLVVLIVIMAIIVALRMMRS